MRTRILFVLCILAGAFLLRTVFSFFEGAPDEVRSVAEERAEAFRDERGPPSALLRVRSLERPGVSPPSLQPPPEALAGEGVLFAGQGDLLALRSAVETAGGRIIGVLDKLGAIRVRGGGEVFDRLRADGHEVDFNLRVTVPPVPPPFLGEEGGGAGFREGALSFLGVPPGNDEWGEGVRVAVLDTGVAPHPALDGARIHVLDLVDRDGEGLDRHGHGTAMIYQLAGRDELDTGMVPAAEILSIRVLDTEGRGNSFTLAEGIVAAVEQGARVINLSLGSPGDSAVLRAALDYAEAHNVIVVAAAGNENIPRVAFPAAYENVLSVTAIDAQGSRAPFTNIGKVDIAAPGIALPAAWLDEGYVWMDGTSGAAAIVSGAIVRMLSEDPHLSPQDVRAVLAATTNDLGAPGPDPVFGMGLLDLERLERRHEPMIHDLAVADFHVPLERLDGPTVPLTVTFQNRGTEPVNGARLQIRVDGLVVRETLVSLHPNALWDTEVAIRGDRLGHPEGVVVEAVIVPPAHIEDARPGDNVRRQRFRLLPKN
ncbi:MAG: S8 family serine peptidase [Opitutales bacterium]|nr:S8 family serine peptidase [Opitutales bacterium]